MSALVCLVVLALCALAPALPITSLPGYHGPKLTMDSGYVTVKPGERALFYWMIQSTRSATDPVVFWFQGGPGCSSLYGMLGENGPFMPLANGSIGYRDLSWTNFATMVFTESPAGVGFSYSNNSAWNPTDSNTATDNYAFIQGFFQAHPQLASLPFWLAGESYGGMYVPTLADKITSNPASPLFSKFAGFMVGNPVFDCNESTNTNSFVDPFYWHGAVSYYDYNAWMSNGCGTDASSASCSDILNAISNGVGNSDQEAKKKRVVGASPLPSWDPDNLYQNFVTDNGTLSIVNSQPDDGSFEPVISDLMIAYLSKPSTQAAIHVAPFLGNVPWAPCAQVGYSSDIGSLVPFYKKIHAAKPSLKILVYSGDVDIATVPFFETDRCTAQFGAPRTRSWGPWYVNLATAGYWEQYSWYTRAFIKGAGHEAPGYQPLAAMNMAQRFIETGSLHDPAMVQGASNVAASKKKKTTKHLTQSDMLRMLRAKQRKNVQ